jgi:lysophospholipase L1-like esterase
VSTARALVAAIALVLGLLGSEALVRAVAPQFVFGPLGDSVDGVTVLKPGLHARMSAPGEFDVRVTTNAHRLRARREYSEWPSDDTLRIVALGDSFTFGWGADDEETYPARLEAWLGTHTRQRVDVVNAGVPDTGPGEQVLWYEMGPGLLHPDLVVLGVTYTDPADEAERHLFVPHGAAVEPRPLAERRRDVDAVREVVHAIPGFGLLASRSHALNLVRKITTRAMRQRSGSPRPPDGSDAALAMLDVVRAEIAWFSRRLAARGVALVVAFLPERERVTRGAASPPPWTDALVASLRAECTRRGIPFVDATETMRGRAAGGAALFFPHDPHPNPAGYDALATDIGTFLIANALVTRK